MSNEIYHSYEEGNALYALVWRKADDLVWNELSDAFETYTDADIDEYDIPLDNIVDSDYYSVDFPAAITDTDQQAYRVQVFLRIGGGIDADADMAVAQGEIFWNGVGEVDIGTINITNNTVTNIIDEQVTPGVTVIDETINV